MKIHLMLFLLLLGLSLFWFPILILTQQGYPYDYFIDIPTLITVIFPAFLILLAFHKPKQILNAIGHLRVIHILNLDELSASLKVWRNFGIILILWGNFFTQYKLIEMMRYANDHRMVGVTLIFSYNSTLYGILLATVLAFPAYLIIEKRLSIANGKSESNLSESGYPG